MAHIALMEGLPGIRGLMVFSPETTKPLCELVQVLLTGPHSLTPADREMIATYVSSENDCYYCQHCHGSTAAQHLGGGDKNYEFIAEMKRGFESSALSPKMKALLNIAGKVQKGGKQVTTACVERARQEGVTDKEIHDTVLIAAAFCMFNRYVDGLATWQPHDPDVYREIGRQTARLGYVGRDYNKPLESIAAKQRSPVTKVANRSRNHARGCGFVCVHPWRLERPWEDRHGLVARPVFRSSRRAGNEPNHCGGSDRSGAGQQFCGRCAGGCPTWYRSWWRSRDYSVLAHSLLWVARFFNALRFHVDFLCGRGSCRPRDSRACI